MKLVVDSSVLIDDLRGGTRWKDVLVSLTDDVELYLPTVVLFELYSGSSSKDTAMVQKIKKLISFFDLVPLTDTISRRAGEIYRDSIKGLEVPDYIIAASSMEINAEVVTLNKKHFQKIPGVRIYDFDNEI